MITQVYPKDFQRFLSLPVLGPWMNSYAAWLHEQQYTHRSSRYELRMAARVSEFLKRRGFQRVEDIGQDDLQACYQWFQRKFPREEGGVRVLESFLVEKALLHPIPVPEPSPRDVLLNRYMAHLLDDHGYVPSTIRRQGCIVAEFLDGIKYEEQPNRLAQVCMKDIEDFIRRLGKRMGRVSLQKPISVIRHFLRFFAASGTVPHGLDSQIDTPRVYRQEQLPRALPWTTVEAFLHSIDRKTFMGKRDYAMFSIMATYGLRACDVVALKLDDIKWRSGCIRICQKKTGNPLELPLTNEVSSALYDYLKKVPRYGEYRQVFLRLRAPGGTLKSTAVAEAFQAWSRKSGLDIPFQGTYCLRHSYALNLFHHGLPLKTIGDLLGHRSPESTAVYIRLFTEDLREVPLHIPAFTEQQEEVGS
ncbi:MAG: tyrosine-type recombinase/integrase [Desulfoarculaceae bacterium]|nr:tyrosine-type recombinase/integrase [Desulfoarculaceae bacterium]